MQLPNMVASTPPQPEAAFYGQEALQLFPRLTRAEFTAQFGFQPPPWNPALRIKRWWDSTTTGKDPQGIYLYHAWVLDEHRKPVYREQFLTNAEAALPNLPGITTYLQYKPAPLDARMMWMGGTLGAPPADSFCFQSEAEMLVKDLNAAFPSLGAVFQEADNPVGLGQIIFAPTELRRSYNIVWGGIPHSAGLILREKYRVGIDAPGKWTLSQDGQYVSWEPARIDTGEQDLRPEWPLPMRDLLANEAWKASPFNPFQLARTDRGESAGGSSSLDLATLTAALDAVWLKRGAAWIDQLLARFGR